MVCGVLAEMSLKRRIPVNYMDSDAGRALATRIGVGRMRHIQVRWLWLQERIRDGDIAAKRVDGAKNVADLGTKHLEAGRRDELLDLMGLRLTRRRLTSSTRTAFVAAALQLQAADAATGTLETVVDVISVWVWILNDVMRPMAILLVLTIVAYRLWTWGPHPRGCSGWSCAASHRRQRCRRRRRRPPQRTPRLRPSWTVSAWTG